MKFLFSILFALLLVSRQPCLILAGEEGFENQDQTRIVSDLKTLRSALSKIEPGNRILISPGIYKGGFALRGIQGTKDSPIVIEAENPELPPSFTTRGEAVKLSRVAYIKLKNIHIKGVSGNGINIDDGGDVETPSHHVILENLLIRDIGAKGNVDAIKMSGVDHFVVKHCRIAGWGGSGIDMVGCHQGIVQDCRFEGLPGFRTKNALQIKGGSKKILVQNSVFINCGERAVNLGGQYRSGLLQAQGCGVRG